MSKVVFMIIGALIGFFVGWWTGWRQAVIDVEEVHKLSSVTDDQIQKFLSDLEDRG